MMPIFLSDKLPHLFSIKLFKKDGTEIINIPIDFNFNSKEDEEWLILRLLKESNKYTSRRYRSV